MFPTDNPLQCDCRLLWLRDVNNQTFGRLFRRSFKQLKCVFRTAIGDFKHEEETKISQLVREIKFIQTCEPKLTIEEVEEVLETVKEKNEDDESEEVVQQVVTSERPALPRSKQTESPEAKISSTQSMVETSPKEQVRAEKTVIESKNDIKPEEKTNVVKANKERTGAKTSHSTISSHNTVLICLAAIVCIGVSNDWANRRL